MSGRRIACGNENDTQRLGAALARALVVPAVIHLRGDLGAGKTTLARALVQALAPGTRVKSPTYTLLESYATPAGPIHHLDLYRIADPRELDALGVRELAGVVLIEWPEHGGAGTPPPDLAIELRYSEPGREVVIDPITPAGERIAAGLGSSQS